jgi:hypothetical protein
MSEPHILKVRHWNGDLATTTDLNKIGRDKKSDKKNAKKLRNWIRDKDGYRKCPFRKKFDGRKECYKLCKRVFPDLREHGNGSCPCARYEYEDIKAVAIAILMKRDSQLPMFRFISNTHNLYRRCTLWLKKKCRLE